MRLMCPYLKKRLNDKLQAFAADFSRVMKRLGQLWQKELTKISKEVTPRTRRFPDPTTGVVKYTVGAGQDFENTDVMWAFIKQENKRQGARNTLLMEVIDRDTIALGKSWFVIVNQEGHINIHNSPDKY